ncbi:hypothetical protein BDN70DRAFT_840872 [Pholiota conissans]|uniref:MYND-type domain-containing protein n=1 Tax=Pholiota conissans TaxID=109636 RepID=A0A9P6CQ64_9AGAR|nr:hypothetical protein BDN70DRAFT_840872 [Pholiota conissans]
MPSSLSCSVCNKPGSNGVDIKRCGRCRDRFYCGRDCQASDWPTHKRTCGAISPRSENAPLIPKWYDKYRKCRDGNLHEGNLELITWSCTETEDGILKGWGNVDIEESADLKEKFEKEFKGDEKELHRYWPEAFRWTCCGTDAGIEYGCDHHGTGSTPCSCDFCTMGKPLPDKYYCKQSSSRLGLSLRRGPDPRSFNPAKAMIAESARAFLGRFGAYD